MGLLDMLNKSTGENLTGDQVKMTVDHPEPAKQARIHSLIRTATDIEELYRQGKIDGGQRDILYSEIKSHIQDPDEGLGGITGVLNPKIVDKYEAKNPDRKG